MIAAVKLFHYTKLNGDEFNEEAASVNFSAEKVAEKFFNDLNDDRQQIIGFKAIGHTEDELVKGPTDGKTPIGVSLIRVANDLDSQSFISDNDSS